MSTPQVMIIAGNMESVLTDQDFEALVDKYMGRDAEAYVRQLHEDSRKMDLIRLKAEAAVDTDLNAYEMTLESNAGAFQDIQDWVISLKNHLKEKRLDRGKINNVADQIMKILKNQI